MLSKYLKVVDAIIILFQVSEYRLRVYNTIFRRGLFLGPVRGNQVNNDFFSLFSHIMSFVLVLNQMALEELISKMKSWKFTDEQQNIIF